MNVHHNPEKSKKLQRPELQRKCQAVITYRLDQAKEILPSDSDERVAKKTLESDFPLFFSFNLIHNHQTNRHEHSRLHTSNFTFDIDVPVRGYTMHMPVASPCACAWQCHGHVHGVAMGMCMA